MYNFGGRKYKNIKEYKDALKISKNCHQAYTPWTFEQDKELIRLASSATVSDLSQSFKRTPGAIRSRIEKLGIERKIGYDMIRKPKSQSSNLFSIDFEAIEIVLEEANRPLIAGAEEILSITSKLQHEISDNLQAEEAAELLKKLRKQIQEISRA